MKNFILTKEVFIFYSKIYLCNTINVILFFERKDLIKEKRTIYIYDGQDGFWVADFR